MAITQLSGTIITYSIYIRRDDRRSGNLALCSAGESEPSCPGKNRNCPPVSRPQWPLSAHDSLAPHTLVSLPTLWKPLPSLSLPFTPTASSIHSFFYIKQECLATKASKPVCTLGELKSQGPMVVISRIVYTPISVEVVNSLGAHTGH